ncbi:phage tail tape measure protein [Chromobacterium vaccinii]|uniref:phage tail tape measure protein n=1 Tax=Chromobacterium vaccinii TaxID=1108595 RepID=UPI003C776779
MSNEQIGRGILEFEVRESGATASIAKIDQALGGIEKATDRATKAVEATGKSLSSLKDAAKSVGDVGSNVQDIGNGGDVAARKIDAVTRNMINSIQRATVSMEVGGKASADYYRLLAQQRGIDTSALDPYLSQLDMAAKKANIASEATRKFSEGSAFDKKLAEAAKLNQANEYVQFWIAALDEAEATEKRTADSQAFQKRLTEASKLNQANEYVRFWVNALDEAEAKERQFAAASALSASKIADEKVFNKKLDDAKKLNEASEYVRFWTNALDEADAAENKLSKQNNFLAGIKSQIDSIGKSRSDILEMQAAQLGISDKAAPLINRLKETEAGYRRTGLSAGEMSNAIRMLPAQFTDIAVSLAGGQNPMMVFLQQGGQIKDMFGSVGEASKAMGAYVLGLVNPFTIAAAAVAAFSYAAYAGHKESLQLSMTLSMTRNAAGLTAESFRLMAESVARTSNTSLGSSRDTIMALIGSGKLAGDTLKNIATSAQSFADVTGEKGSKAAKDFEDAISGDVKKLAEMNERFGFLTAAQFEHIASLKEAGREEQAKYDASVIISQHFAEVSLQSLGTIEKAWVSLINKVGSYWDAVKSIGRTPELGDNLKLVNDEIAHLESESKGNKYWASFNKERLQELYNQRSGLESDIRRLQVNATKESEQQAVQKAGVQANMELEKKLDTLRTGKEKIKHELEELDKLVSSARAAGLGSKYDDATVAKMRQGIIKKYGEKERKPSAFGRAEDREVADLQSRIQAENQIATAMRTSGASYEKMTEGQKLALKYRQQEGVAITEAARANLRLRASLADELGQRQELTAALKERISVQRSLDEADQRRASDMQLQREDMAKQLEFMTMSIGQRERAQAQWAVEMETKRQLLDLQIKINQARADEAAATTEAARTERHRIVEDLEAEQRLLGKDAAQRAAAAVQAVDDKMSLASNWTVGAKAALADYADNAIRIGGEVGNAFSRAMGGMEDALTKFVSAGKLSFKDLANSIIEDLIRIQIRQSITGPLAGFMSGMFGRSGPAAPIVDGTSIGIGPLQAAGGAWLSGAQLFATGAAFTNSIVSRPTAFAHTAGLGVMGEAGPEAIMPLTRDGSGRLGVRSAGGGAPSVDIQVNVINQSSQPLQAQQQGQPRLDQFGNLIVDMIVTDMRRGGPISSTMERAFGLRRGG